MLAVIRIYGGGAFTSGGLPPGVYDAVAVLNKDDVVLNMKARSVTLRNGETTEVQMDLMAE
jgi:hypothetical protein